MPKLKHVPLESTLKDIEERFKNSRAEPPEDTDTVTLVGNRELDAFRRIHEALLPIASNDRQRIIRCVCILMQIHINPDQL